MGRKKNIDETDIKIIKRLLKNSRTSFAEIAEECKVSTLTIKNRYNRLKKMGIIKGSTVIANFRSFGIESFAVALVVFDNRNVNQSIKNLQSSIKGKHSILSWNPTKFNERYDVVLYALTKSISEVQKIKETLKKQPSVVNVEMNIQTSIKNFPQNLDLQP